MHRIYILDPRTPVMSMGPLYRYELQDELERNAVANVVTRKPVVAGEEEVGANARSLKA